MVVKNCVLLVINLYKFRLKFRYFLYAVSTVTYHSLEDLKQIIENVELNIQKLLINLIKLFYNLLNYFIDCLGKNTDMFIYLYD